MAKLFTAAKSYGHAMGKRFTFATMTGTVTCFRIEKGPILIHQLGFMVDILMAGTNTLKFTYTIYGGVAGDLCTAIDTDAAVVGTLFTVPGIAGDALVKRASGIGILSTDYEHMPMLLSIGSIKAVWGGTSTAGTGLVYMEYSPCSHYTQVHAE